MIESEYSQERRLATTARLGEHSRQKSIPDQDFRKIMGKVHRLDDMQYMTAEECKMVADRFSQDYELMRNCRYKLAGEQKMLQKLAMDCVKYHMSHKPVNQSEDIIAPF